MQAMKLCALPQGKPHNISCGLHVISDTAKSFARHNCFIIVVMLIGQALSVENIHEVEVVLAAYTSLRRMETTTINYLTSQYL